MNERIVLISTSTSGNGIKLKVTENRNEVFCNKESISQKEYFESNAAGLKAELKIKLWRQDYKGEQIAEYNGQRYKIYRTYEQFDMIELYLANEG